MISNLSFPLLIFTLTVFGILSIVVLLGNGFIVIVIEHQWLQKKKMIPCDFLLFTLSTSRFFLQLTSVVYYALHFISPETSLHSYREEDIFFILIFFNSNTRQITHSYYISSLFFWKVTIMGSNSMSPLDILIWTFLGIIYIVSFLGNGFITIVLGHQWLQNKKMLSCDILLTSLSTSRFVMQVTASLNSLLYFISSETYAGSSRKTVLDVIWLFFHMASIMSATWLSIFYCMKVTDFANHVFFWLRSKINVLAPRLLGLSIVISIIFSIPSVVEYFGYKKWSNLIGTPPGYANQSVVHKRNRVFLPLHVTFASINFSISTIACTLLLSSLWKHTRNLKKSGIVDKDLRSQVHINVIISLLFYVFFYLLYFSSIIIITTDTFNYGSTERLVFEILATTFPSAHSIILILTNPKLKEIATRILNMRQTAA